MPEKDFGNAREGMDFHIAYDGESYDVSVMINKRTCHYEIMLNQSSVKSGSLCWTWNCFVETLEVDGHQFFIVVQRDGVFSLRYQIDCFADGISVSDGKTTLESFRRELVKFPLLRSMKSALRDPFGFLLGFIGFFLLVFCSNGQRPEMFGKPLSKGMPTWFFWCSCIFCFHLCGILLITSAIAKHF